MKWPWGLFPSRKPPWTGLDFNEVGIQFENDWIPWGAIHRGTAGLLDCFSHDLIWIRLEYGDESLNLWEDWPRFYEFAESIQREIGFDDEPLGYLRTHAFSEREFVLFDRKPS